MLALLGFLLTCQAYKTKFTAGGKLYSLDIALIELYGRFMVAISKLHPSLFCIPRAKRNHKELVFKRHTWTLLSSFEA